jgi:hypothetical protein
MNPAYQQTGSRMIVQTTNGTSMKKKKKLGLPIFTFSEEQRFSNASRNVCIGIFSLLICRKKELKSNMGGQM